MIELFTICAPWYEPHPQHPHSQSETTIYKTILMVLNLQFILIRELTTNHYYLSELTAYFTFLTKFYISLGVHITL